MTEPLAPGPLPETSYAVLGLVDKVSGSSGHELAALAGNSLAFFWPVSRTLLYRELARLTDLRWIEATRVEQTHAPSKWTYRTTTAGQSALAEWLMKCPDTIGSQRNPFLLHLFFSYRLSEEQTLLMLRRYRELLTAHRDRLAAIVGKLDGLGTDHARAGRLAVSHGLRTVEAQLAWTDEVGAHLSGGSP